MDARIERAVERKVAETVSNIHEIFFIHNSVIRNIYIANTNDFVLGIAIGRIYNSFHYQTRRTLKREATQEEFAEFLDIVSNSIATIKECISRFNPDKNL
jgi:hypothetical protein